MTREPWAPWRDARTIATLVRLYRELRPDVVHHVTLKPIVLGSVAARIAHVPMVINSFAGLGYAFNGESTGAPWRRRAMLELIKRSLKRIRQTSIFENHDDRALLVDAGAVESADSMVIPGVGVDTEMRIGISNPPRRQVHFAERALW